MLTTIRPDRVRVLLALLWMPAWAQALPQAELQTLFYTPAQRQAMSRERLGLAGEPEAATLRLNGVVQRAAGKGTVWLNHQAHREGSPPVGTIHAGDAVVQGRPLRVGESMDKASGVRTDVLAPGAVSVRTPP